MKDKNLEKVKNSGDGPMIEDVDLGTRLAANPVIWFGLMMIPVCLAILAALIGAATPEQPAPVQKPAAVQTAEASQEMPANIDRAPGGSRTLNCNFEIWTGRPLNRQQTEWQLKAMNRPYRILPPGSMMTMDHNPARVNIDIDDQAIVKRVWCG